MVYSVPLFTYCDVNRSHHRVLLFCLAVQLYCLSLPLIPTFTVNTAALNYVGILPIMFIRTALGPAQLPIQWVPRALSTGIKRPGREADHSPASSAEVKEWVELYLHSPNTQSWHGAQFKKKHRDNSTFTFTFPLLHSAVCLMSVTV
jgi:hypothetical protein